MSWLILIIAGLFEVCWAILLKYTNGFTHIGYPFGELRVALEEGVNSS
ncbi:SMR family transporter [Legionella antarctica]|nr:SMR family transporter [Legionella antarctica]